MVKSLITLLPALFLCPLAATEIDPWLLPLGEFKVHADYEIFRQNKIQSPDGPFYDPSTINMLQTTLQVSPLPYLDAQLSLDFASTSQIPFNYAATRLMGRYQLMDEDAADPLSIVAGIYVEFPMQTYIQTISFYYTGTVDAEGSICIGKSYYPASSTDWLFQGYVYGGFGAANQGSPWFSVIAHGSYQFLADWELALEAQSRFSLGRSNLTSLEDFQTQGALHYQYVDLSAILSYESACLGEFKAFLFSNVYALNTPQYTYGGGLVWNYAFSF
jgi:hypothetical protein